MFSDWLFSSHLWQTPRPAAGGLPRPLHRHPRWAGAREGAKCKIPSLFSVSILSVLSLVPYSLPRFITLVSWNYFVLVSPTSCPISSGFLLSAFLCRSLFSSFDVPLHSSIIQWLIFFCHSGHLTPSFMRLSPYFSNYLAILSVFLLKLSPMAVQWLRLPASIAKGVGSIPVWGTKIPDAPGMRAIAQSCQTLCSFMDCSPPGSSVHGIFQARILEWVAISYSRASSQPRD